MNCVSSIFVAIASAQASRLTFSAAAAAPQRVACVQSRPSNSAQSKAPAKASPEPNGLRACTG